jgi:hypothetical protein
MFNRIDWQYIWKAPLFLALSSLSVGVIAFGFDSMLFFVSIHDRVFFGLGFLVFIAIVFRYESMSNEIYRLKLKAGEIKKGKEY